MKTYIKKRISETKNEIKEAQKKINKEEYSYLFEREMLKGRLQAFNEMLLKSKK